MSEIKNVTSLEINRKEWTAAFYAEDTKHKFKDMLDQIRKDKNHPMNAMLGFDLDGNRYQCCMGHLGTACGYGDERLSQLGMPGSLDPINPFFGYNNDVAGAAHVDAAVGLAFRAAAINDSSAITLAEKEEQLIKLFAENGITLSFVGEV